jgi:hypothetical protein
LKKLLPERTQSVKMTSKTISFQNQLNANENENGEKLSGLISEISNKKNTTDAC